MKVNFLLIIVLFLFIGSVNATAKLEPQVLVMQVADETILRLQRDKVLIDKDPKYVHKVIDELLLPHFDFKKMSKWVLGKYWRKAKPAQRDAFTDEFKSLLVRTYANALLEYSEQKIKYLPFRGKLESGDVTVRSEIDQPGGFPIPINYRLHLLTNQWKVYDVSIDEISLIANYRSSFSRQIRKSGIDKLIQRLADKNQ